jgi:biotin-(acetyl-CoA carboxylase) ligase
VDRVKIVRCIVEGICDGLPHLTSEALLERWRGRTATLGREVSIVTGGVTVSGVAVDITSSGALLVRDAAGTTHEVVAGDCVHRVN